MANVIHRTTLEFRSSVNEPDFPEPTWKWNPDMTAVVGVLPKYWKAPADWDAVGAGPIEMSQAEKDAVDAADLSASRDAIAAVMDEIERWERAFALTLLDEFNAHADKINAILTAIDSGANLTAVKTNIANIADYPQRTVAQLKASLRNKLGS